MGCISHSTARVILVIGLRYCHLWEFNPGRGTAARETKELYCPILHQIYIRKKSF